ncbi:MAG TPA: hypothetical protein VMT81_01690 [Candidatus Paceibacterota bacterium]|nr:hypothetical protein [Candidatus Paceibacterota bacterium]
MEELLAHQACVPSICRDGITSFFATTLEAKGGDYYVPGFVWDGLRYVHYYYCLRMPFYGRMFAAYLS